MRPLSLTNPITWPALEAAAEALRLRGGRRGLSAATIPGALSDARLAFARLVDRKLGLASEREALTLLLTDPTLDLRDLFRAVPLEAAARHPRNRRSAANAKSRVKALLSALVSGLGRTASVTVQRHRAPATYQPLFDALTTALDSGKLKERRHSDIAGGIIRFACVGAVHGVTDWRDLPTDTAALRSLVQSWGLSYDETTGCLWALRAARPFVVAAGIALPEWPRLRTGRVVGVTEAERMAHLASTLPLWAAALRQYDTVIAVRRTDAARAKSEVPTAPGSDQDSGRRARRKRRVGAIRARSVRVTRDAIYRTAPLVAAAHAAGVLPGVRLDRFGLVEGWTVMVPEPGADAVARETVATDSASEMLGAMGLSVETAGTTVPIVPALIAVALWAAQSGRITRSQVRNRLPPAMANDVERLWSLTRDAYQPLLAQSSDPAKRSAWATLEMTWNQYQPMTRNAKRDGGRVKDKPRALKVMTAPQLVCIALPLYTLVRLPTAERLWRATQDACVAKGWDTGAHAAEARVRDEFQQALERWAAAAVYTAWPLRRTNWWAARLSADPARRVELNLVVDWNPDGTILRLRSARCWFASEMPDNPLAALKQDGIVEHSREASDVIFDRGWFGAYLTHAWWPTLRAVVPEVASLSLREALESGRYPVFVCDPRGATTAGAPHPGGFSSPQRIGYRLGDFVLDAARAMGRTGLPSSAEYAAREGWPYAFASHIERLRDASYWLGIRGVNGPRRVNADGTEQRESGVTVAMTRTTDTEKTLQRDYNAVSETVKEMLRRPTDGERAWDHPAVYNAIMDLTWWDGARVDWAERWADPTFPLPAEIRREFQLAVRRAPRPEQVRRRRAA